MGDFDRRNSSGPREALETEVLLLMQEKIDLCLKQYVPIAAETAMFPLNQETVGLFIAEIASKTMLLKMQVQTDRNQETHVEEILEEIQDAQKDVCLALFAITAAKHVIFLLNQEPESRFFAVNALKTKKMAQ